ncbi:Flp pilus assembly complex ATPase component TadA, partial [Trichocoleus sp. DQ-A3]|uniref:ATPase, T2SS/T4P/T4SS family n=1 Tax=Cyanophyceae TaxID=3028117 RepID=UPI001685CFB5
MQTSITFPSAWQQLKSHKITCEEAVKLLVDEQGVVNLDLLDSEVNLRFFRKASNRQSFPPLIPLLLWRNCYYLGSTVALKEEEVKKLSHCTLTDIKIIPIAEKSYRAWYVTQTFNTNSISATSLINPLTGEAEPEDITETTELCLSRAADQIGRVKTIISGALRNRASDIHLEPMPEGLRVRYRIDGVLRNITTLPLDVSRKVVVTLKVMSEIDIAESRRPQDGR